MKKTLLVVPIALALYACGGETVKEAGEQADTDAEVHENQSNEESKSAAEKAEWEVDEALLEPMKGTACYMCNMEVFTRDHEQGVFSAQAIRENGEVVFYDDIGCLLNDEYVNNVENEKFVRDYHTLNWFNVEEAFPVKTNIKSPMNWGYIFFKDENDATEYIAYNENTALTSVDEIRDMAIERHKKKIHSQDGHADVHGSQDHSTVLSSDISEEHHGGGSSNE